MSKPKKISDKPLSEYIKQKLEEKKAFSEALQKGLNIRELARERGIQLVQPL